MMQAFGKIVSFCFESPSCNFVEIHDYIRSDEQVMFG